MESDWAFSGSFSSMLGKTSRFSVSNTSRLSSDYLGNDEIHKLILSNLAYSVSAQFKSTLGGIYTNSGGFKPTVGVQYLAGNKAWRWMLFPNVNIGRQPDLMTISMIQFLRGISQKVKFVFRIQSLSILNSGGHAFSTARFRSGIVHRKSQFGLASDFNFFDRDFALVKSFGLFFQYQLF